MAKRRELHRLEAPKVGALIKAKTAGRHADGGGLYLSVDPNGAARWVFIYRWKPNRSLKGPGRLREMGLGGVQAVSLKRAREKAALARVQLKDEGIDPIAARRATDSIPTFGEIADKVEAIKIAESKSKAVHGRIKYSLQVHAAPLRSLRVDQVDTAAVLETLKPIWTKTPEAAQKTRGLIEAVLNAAKAKGYRGDGVNPAQWRNHLDHLLPKQSKLARGHHAAMAYADVPAFMTALRGRDAMAARALELVILTAGRAGEILGAEWSEFDLKAKLWTIPAKRMKSGREHRVALSDRAVEILEALEPVRTGPLVFPGPAGKKPMSGPVFDRLMARMKVEDVTTHGFRSAFRTWVGEATSYPRELAEVALAHVVGDSVERAYARGDLLERRRKLMQAWANYCAGKTADIRKLAG